MNLEINENYTPYGKKKPLTDYCTKCLIDYPSIIYMLKFSLPIQRPNILFCNRDYIDGFHRDTLLKKCTCHKDALFCYEFVNNIILRKLILLKKILIELQLIDLFDIIGHICLELYYPGDDEHGYSFNSVFLPEEQKKVLIPCKMCTLRNFGFNYLPIEKGYCIRKFVKITNGAVNGVELDNHSFIVSEIKNRREKEETPAATMKKFLSNEKVFTLYNVGDVIYSANLTEPYPGYYKIIEIKKNHLILDFYDEKKYEKENTHEDTSFIRHINTNFSGFFPSLNQLYSFGINSSQHSKLYVKKFRFNNQNLIGYLSNIYERWEESSTNRGRPRVVGGVITTKEQEIQWEWDDFERIFIRDAEQFIY